MIDSNRIADIHKNLNDDTVTQRVKVSVFNSLRECVMKT